MDCVRRIPVFVIEKSFMDCLQAVCLVVLIGTRTAHIVF